MIISHDLFIVYFKDDFLMQTESLLIIKVNLYVFVTQKNNKRHVQFKLSNFTDQV